MLKYSKKFLILLISVLLVTAFTACEQPNPDVSEKTEENKTSSEKEYGSYPKFDLTEKEVKLMANWTRVDEEVTQTVKDMYGLKIELIKTGWSDIPTKLATYIMSGQSPDMVLLRADNDDYPKFVLKELVQPIDEFIDLEHPLYGELKEVYSMTEWDGKHYILLESVGTGTAVYYNKQLLTNYGLELPWDLYKQDKWNWNTFRDLALELKTESKDGTITVYGFALHRPYPLAYTPGKPFGHIDGNKKTIVNNINDADIARAMNFMSDMIIEDKVAPPVIDGTLNRFKNEQVGMVIAEQIYQMPEVIELAKAGKLGIAPIPKDPNADAHYVRGFLGGWFIPVGATNPKGAVAVASARIYMNKDEVRKANIQEKMKLEYALSDKNLEQLDAAHKDGVKPIIETTPWIGYDSIWNMVGNVVNWNTQIAADLPRINARISELFEENEYDAPTGPKTIDNFESYGQESNENILKYFPISGGDTSIRIGLSSDEPKEGKYCAKVEYEIGEKKWCGIGKNVDKTWKGNNTMQLWIKGDGEPQKIGLQFITAGNAIWSASLEIASNEWKQYEIPLESFELPEWIDDQVEMDLTSISAFNISFGSEQEETGRYAYFDNIEIVRK